nr:ribbon-helix-helix protein, CopG family [uncultured Acetatifactor sp.]
MDKETVEKLDCLASEQNSDRSKIIRQGIEIQYEQRDKK